MTSNTSVADPLSGTGSACACTLADDPWLCAELDCFFLALGFSPGTFLTDLAAGLYRSLCS